MYQEERGDIIERWNSEHEGTHIIEGVLGFVEAEPQLEKDLLKCLGQVWKKRGKKDRERWGREVTP